MLPALCVLGCASRTVVGTVQVPATVPLRTFPHILVASGHQPSEILLASELVAHLQSARSDQDVRRVSRDQLEPMRQRGEIPVASVVVLVELDARSRTRTRFSTRPETVCGPTGCFTRNRTDSYDVPTLFAQTRITVFEGPSARVLQRLSLDVTEEGRGYDRMRDRAVRRLAVRLKNLVDARVEQVRVRLLDVNTPAVEQALLEMEEGRWREGRVRLERFVRGDGLSPLSSSDRARVYYDLAMARRFDPVSLERDPERHFQAAEAPLQRAIRLDPAPLYDEALRALRRHRSHFVVLQEQEQAAEHNYQLRGQTTIPPPETLPTPPPGYGQ